MDYTGFERGGYDADAVQQKFDPPERPVHVLHDGVRFDTTHRIMYSQQTDDGIDPRDSGDHAAEFLRGALKAGASLVVDGTEDVVESMAQHKYSRLANASYDYFDSKGKVDAVHDGLSSEEFRYVEDLKDFKMDTELSTIDNVVLHNAVTGETHISYRGTTNNPVGETKAFVKDWRINGEIAGGSITTKRMRQADKQMDRVIAKYGRDSLTVSGHSQGSNISYQQAVKNDLPGYHFNGAINATQVREAEKYAENVAVQNMYKTPLDFASPLAYHRNLRKANVRLNIVQNLKNKDGIIDTHSIDQFAPQPKSVSDGLITAERRTLFGSIAKGSAKIAGAGLVAYDLAEDFVKDAEGNKPRLEVAADVAIDTAKTAEEFMVDGEIIDLSLAFAPETMGLSVVFGAGAVILNDLVAEHAAVGLKKSVPRVGKFFKDTGKKIMNWF